MFLGVLYSSLPPCDVRLVALWCSFQSDNLARTAWKLQSLMYTGRLMRRYLFQTSDTWMRWEMYEVRVFFIWQISKMWSPTPVKSLGGKGLERFLWAQVLGMVEVRMLPGFICFFFQMFCYVSLLFTGSEVFECFVCYTSRVWTDLVVNRHWIKLSFDHISDLRIRMSGIHISLFDFTPCCRL